MADRVDWSYYHKFDDVNKKWLPDVGEGDNAGTQAVTAVNKLVYKWYNDGDVYDNTHRYEGGMVGWANDLSSYANWLYSYIPNTQKMLKKIFQCKESDRGDYEQILKKVADLILNEERLNNIKNFYEGTIGSVYVCEGPFEFEEGYGYDDEDDDWDEEEDY